jgi:beta-glucosidase
MLPDAAGESFKRLVGFTRVKLDAKEKRAVSVAIEPKYLSIFDEAKDAWTLVPGDYTIMVGGSSQDLPLKATINLK